MRVKLYLIPILIILVLSLAISACGGEEPVPTEVPEVVVTEQPEVQPVEQTTSSSGETISGNIQVTELEQIVGTWIAAAFPGNYVLTVFPDGRLSMANTLEDLERGSTDTWYLEIEDGKISATGFALCLGDTGTYIADIDEVGNLRFITIIDACDSRIRRMDRSLPGRIHEYKLVYRPVE